MSDKRDIVDRLRSAYMQGEMPLGQSFDALLVVDEMMHVRAERDALQAGHAFCAGTISELSAERDALQAKLDAIDALSDDAPFDVRNLPAYLFGYRDAMRNVKRTRDEVAADTRTPSFTADEWAELRRYIRMETEPGVWRTLAERDTEWRDYITGRFGPNVAAWVLGESPVPCQTCGGSGKVPGMHHAVGDLLFPCPTCRGGQ